MMKPLWLTPKPKVMHGFIQRDKSTAILSNCAVGTFLIRLTDSNPGCLAIDFVDDNTIGHVLCAVRPQSGFSLILSDGRYTSPTFPDLMMKVTKFTTLHPDVSKDTVFSSETDEPN